MPSAYANQSAGELSSMCDAPQTTEALAVRRSRVVGGVGPFLLHAGDCPEVLEGVWKSQPREMEGQGTRTRQGHPGSLELEAEGKAEYHGWWLVACLWGLSRGGHRLCGEAGSTSINAFKPSGAEGVLGHDRQRYSTSWRGLKRVHTSLTSFSACSDGLAAVFGRRRALNIRLGRRINNSILPESSLDEKKASVGRNLRTFCSASMHHV
jgi:hypothetical protein